MELLGRRYVEVAPVSEEPFAHHWFDNRFPEWRQAVSFPDWQGGSAGVREGTGVVSGPGGVRVAERHQ